MRTFFLFLALLQASGAKADYYMGEIIVGGWNFCPRGSLPADGRLLSIAEHTSLYSLLGSTYGGDGRTTMGLPDLRGRAPVGPSQTVRLGSKVGAQTATMGVQNLPPHSHGIDTSSLETKESDVVNTAGGSSLLQATSRNIRGHAKRTLATQTTMPQTTESTGDGQPFNIINPQLGVQYCVVTDGVYPQRS